MGKLPFLMVQLANYGALQTTPVQASGWPLLRESQTLTMRADDKAGMAVITDIGQADDIHPKDKQDVGARLAASALHVAYGQNNVWSGPLYKSMTVEDGKIRVTFDQVGGGLIVGQKNFMTLDPVTPVAGGQLKGFAIAGADNKWVFADAVIDGQTVVVSSPQVAAPVAVRYAWADNPLNNLYNKELLLAAPFRSDLDYGLGVVDGSGGGTLHAGEKRMVQAAAPPAGQTFVKWVGDAAILDNPNAAQATVTMPAQYVSIRATFGN
jgi:sialate O-acetylesterase